MNPNLIDFVQKLTIKRVGKKNQDAEDIAQETFINLHLEGITEIEGNEFRINHLIQYHLNKLNRVKKKFTQIDNSETFDSLLDVETTVCNTAMIETYFNEFRIDSKIREEDLELYYSVKHLRIPYKELTIDNATSRKKVNRVYVKFKDWLADKGVKLDRFYES
tara:strand:+ start:4144 stop:4632 length:489 start_codon:yes stop_codon:yes gene_type:complete